MHQYFLLITFVLLCCPAFGTCIVIIRKGNEILIGTDSRNTRMKSTGEVIGTTDNYCKIRKAGNFYYGLVGIDDVNQMRFAEEVAKEAITVDNFAKLFVPKMGQHYANLLYYMRQVNPSKYLNFCNNLPLGQTPVFRLENGEFKLMLVEFYNDARNGEEPKVREVIWEDADLLVLGSWKYKEHRHRNPSFDQEIAELSRSNDVGLIKRIIDFESSKTPDTIGGPTHIWRFTTSGINWANTDNPEPGCLK